MPSPEQIIEQTVCDRAKQQGWAARKVMFIGYRGAPDRLFGRPGRAVLIEFKREHGVLSEQQKRRQKELTAWGFEVHTCYSIEQAMEILELI